LKEEALDRTIWRARFGRGLGPVVRQTTKWMNDQKGSCSTYILILPFLQALDTCSESFLMIIDSCIAALYFSYFHIITCSAFQGFVQFRGE
jgi:hypothetical protein